MSEGHDATSMPLGVPVACLLERPRSRTRVVGGRRQRVGLSQAFIVLAHWAYVFSLFDFFVRCLASCSVLKLCEPRDLHRKVGPTPQPLCDGGRIVFDTDAIAFIGGAGFIGVFAFTGCVYFTDCVYFIEHTECVGRARSAMAEGPRPLIGRRRWAANGR